MKIVKVGTDYFSELIKISSIDSINDSVGVYQYSFDEEFFDYDVSIKNIEDEVRKVNSSFQIKLVDDRYIFEFTDATAKWQKGFANYFHKNLEQFWRYCTKKKTVPEYFCISDKQLSEVDIDVPILKKIYHATGWLKFISEICDHSSSNNKYVFFLSQDEVRTKKYEIFAPLEVDLLDELPLDSFGDTNCSDELLRRWLIDDVHQTDRQSVMLASFSEIMAIAHGSENSFLYLVSNGQKLFDLYKENYDIYVNRFTVEGQLREIDENYFVFIKSLNEFVNSAQTKAFALPGMIAVIAALAKLDSYTAIIAMLITSYMTAMLFLKSNEVFKESLIDLQDKLKNTYEKYSGVKRVSPSVRVHADESEEKLNFKIDKGLERIRFLDKLTHLSLQGTVLFSVFSFIVILNPTDERCFKLFFFLFTMLQRITS